MEDVTVAIPVFTRTQQLKACLESIPDEFQILVADDGHFEERVSLYREQDVTMYYLGYDRGVGAKRRRLAEECTTEYILFLDPDNRFPHRFNRLYGYLRHNPDCGGVTGLLDEQTHMKDTSRWITKLGPFVIRHGWGRSSPDFIGQAMLCRRAIFDCYTWDPRFRYSREHFDFFLGHTQTKWRFEVLREVIIPHVQEESEYRELRNDTERKRPDRERFREKWGNRVITI